MLAMHAPATPFPTPMETPANHAKTALWLTTTTLNVIHAPPGLFITPETAHAMFVRQVKSPPPDKPHALHV